MKRDDLLYLQNILDAIAAVETYVQGLDRDSFDKNKLVNDVPVLKVEATKILAELQVQQQESGDSN